MPVPFEDRSMTEQRAEFVARWRNSPAPNRRALCRAFRIAPATGYKWLQRYAAEGPAGLQDRSRRPHRSPAQTAPAIERAVLALRAQHPTWGGRKLRVLLARQGVQPLPAASTITAILRRHLTGSILGVRGGRPAAGLALRASLSQRPVADGLQGGLALRGPLPSGTILDDHSRYALRPGRLPQPAHRHRAGCLDGLPALRAARPPAGRQRQSLGQSPGPSLHALDGLAAAPGTSPSATAGPTGSRRPWAKTSASTAPCSATSGGSRRAPIWPAGSPPSMRGARSTTRCGPTRRWPWPCPPAAITSAPGPIRPSCRRCPMAPTIRSARSRPAAGCPSRAATCGLPKALRGQAVAFRPTATDGSWEDPFSDRRPGHPRPAGARLKVFTMSPNTCSPCVRSGHPGRERE